MKKTIRTALLDEISKYFGDPHVELSYTNAWQLLVAVILSAQCTDERVNSTTQKLFALYPDIDDYLHMSSETLESLIYSTGFYKNKARHIIGAARYLCSHHRCRVPDTMEELVKVPGVGRKTANVILSAWFQKPCGIVVDTHVKRVSFRLNLTDSGSPDVIEKDLMKIFPREEWTVLSIGMVLFGRYRCMARQPRCAECGLKEYCRYDQKVL